MKEFNKLPISFKCQNKKKQKHPQKEANYEKCRQALRKVL